MNTDPDHFPIAQSILHLDKPNLLSIAFEDTSSDIDENGGIIESSKIIINEEDSARHDDQIVNVQSIKMKGIFSF